jgi:uncharacterized membrane protein YbaN (DUF454 family)
VNAPPPTSGPVRILFVAAGLGFVGMAYLGAILPGLPTTPWLLAASYCFGRSSPRLQRWLLRSPFFGPLLRDWHEHRGIRRPMKVMAGVMVVTACTLSVAFAGLPTWLRVVIAGCGATGLCVILFVVPTIRPGASPYRGP